MNSLCYWKFWNICTHPMQSTSPFTWTRTWPNSSPCIPELLHSYSHFLLRSCLSSSLLLFHVQRFDFQKIKTSVPDACYRRLWNALQTSSCNRLRALRYWDWSGVAEPEPVDRISFESANLLRCSTHPNPLASKNPSKIHFLLELAESTLSAVKKFWLNFHFVWFKCVQFHLRIFFFCFAVETKRQCKGNTFLVTFIEELNKSRKIVNISLPNSFF